MIVVSKEHLTDVYNVIKSFITSSGSTNEIAVNFDKEKGAVIHIIDGSNVCLTDIELLPEWFETYEPSTDLVGMDYAMLSNAVSASAKNTKISFEKDPNEERVTVHLSNGEANYEIKFVTINRKCLRDTKHLTADKIAELKKMGNGYNVPVLEFGNILRNINSFLSIENNGSAYFSVDENNNLKLSVGDESSDTGSMTTDLLVFEISKSKPSVKSMFSITYLQNLKSEISIVDKEEMYVQMHIGNDIPMIVEMPAHRNTCFITYVLAPKIEH